MSLIVTGSSSKKFKQVPPGMYLARCYRIIQLGTQATNFGDKPQVQLLFEVHGEDNDGLPLVTDRGEPLSVLKTYTLTMNENGNLSKHLESWRGAAFTAEERKEGFDIKKVLGAWAMLNLVASGEYTNIDNITQVPSAIRKNGLPEGFNELKLLSFKDFDKTFFESLSDKTKEKIKSSPEYKKMMGSSDQGNDFDDDIDF